MSACKVVFLPFGRTVTVERGATLLDAAGKAQIAIDSVCGGEGICGRCKMIVREGKISGNVTTLLTREEIRRGVVLACQSRVEGDLLVEIPEETRAREKIAIDEFAQRFRAEKPRTGEIRTFAKSPLVTKVFLKLDPPTLENNLSDCERVQLVVRRQTGITSMQTGLKVIRRLPAILRENDFAVTALVGRRHQIAEIMDLEGGDTSDKNYIAVADVGTTTIVVHLVDAVRAVTVDTQACFNSQSIYGREVTARMIAAEKKDVDELRAVVVEDVNTLIASIASRNGVSLKHVTAVVCAGNTAMMHFLLSLPTRNIRRYPYIAATVQPPPLRAAEVGLKINPRGLLFFVPGISGWVGGDLTAGILATGLDQMDDIGMLMDIGTNGEIILGNKEWLVACSASTGPALEGASVACGMMATQGAIEKVFVKDGDIRYQVIGDVPPEGICGSAVIDLLAVLLERGVIDRSGRLVEGSDPRVRIEDGLGRFVLADGDTARSGREVYVSQDDIENVITAKAAVFAATKILFDRLKLKFSDVSKLFIAGGFGNYINLRNAVAIGLLPDLSPDRMQYVGNTSIWGAKLAALSSEAYATLHEIRDKTTYYDLMGSNDYVEQFRRAMFLPHTDVELFPSLSNGRGSAGGKT